MNKYHLLIFYSQNKKETVAFVLEQLLDSVYYYYK